MIGKFVIQNYTPNTSQKKFIDIQIIIAVFVISNLILIANFLISINKYLNTLFFLLPLTGFFFLSWENKIKVFKYSFKFSIFVIILLSFDNINRPDAALYHLPYISILNENKIIIGLSNLHFRFGHTSIIQYLSAGYNNFLFSESAILIPVCLIFYSVSHFFYVQVKYNFKKNTLLFLFCSLILIQILYDMNRYSGFGNDVPAHLLFFLSCFLFLIIKRNNQDDISVLFLLTFFTFQNKPTLMLIALLLLFYIRNIFIKKNIVIFIFIFFFFLKNILVSSCLVFPIKQTCYNFSWSSSKYFNVNSVDKVSTENEAWAKAWPGSKLSYSDYLKSNWMYKWTKEHGSTVVAKKLTPILILVSLIYLITLFQYKKIVLHKNKKLLFICILCFFGSILWFLKFPTYRYGASYLITFVISTFVLFINQISDNTKKYIKILITFIFFLVVSKYLLKYEHVNQRSVWPNIWPIKTNINKVYLNDEFAFYKANNGLCFFGKSPCTNLEIKNLNMKNKSGYKLFYMKEKL